MDELIKRGLKGAARVGGSGIGYVDKVLYGSGVLRIERSQLPNFLGIGAQKAGTTWLYENMRLHPEIAFPGGKEIHYFDHEFSTNFKRYARLFKEERNKIKGDITPAYSILTKRRIRFIGRVMPDVRLLLLLRNPIDRAWSQAYMNLVTLTGRRLNDVKDEEFFKHFVSRRSRKRSDYRTIITNWLSNFPEEALLVEYYEDIANAPKEMLTRVFRHVGASCEINWEAFPYRRVIVPKPEAHSERRGYRVSSRANRAEVMPARFRAYLEELHCEEIEMLTRMLDARVLRWRCK